jgi:primary-amine oxidase
LLREAGHLGEACRFGSVVLREPPKSVVLAFDADRTAAAREAAAIVLDKADGKAYEAIVSLSDGSVTRWEHVPGVQPQVLLEEFFECEEVVKADAGVQEALRKRGIHEFDGVMVDPWSAGHYGDEEHGRLLRALVWVKMGGPDDNGYAHPVENLVVYVDTNASRVVRIEDHGVIPVPQQPGNYTPDAVVPRTDLTPIEIAQPEGTSFTVDGHEVRWQKWRFRVGFTPREGLVLHTVGYTDGDRERSVLYRASLSEMVVPYGDPAPTHRRKNAFDAGEYNIGTLANPLEFGCDCLGEIHYFDGVVTDGDGRPVTIPNAICLHEEDDGVGWKHVDGDTGAQVRRRRRMVLSSHVTVANYEYLLYWRFYEDGTIECEVRATGIMVTTPFHGQAPPTGTVVDVETYAPIHQHLIVARLDLDVDGEANTIVMTETAQPPIAPDNAHGLALVQRREPLHTEGGFDADWATQRAWAVTNPRRRNAVGAPTAYKLAPSGALPAMIDPDSPVFRRAEVIGHTLWVTPFDPDERWPCGGRVVWEVCGGQAGRKRPHH